MSTKNRASRTFKSPVVQSPSSRKRRGDNDDEESSDYSATEQPSSSKKSRKARESPLDRSAAPLSRRRRQTSFAAVREQDASISTDATQNKSVSSCLGTGAATKPRSTRSSSAPPSLAKANEADASLALRGSKAESDNDEVEEEIASPGVKTAATKTVGKVPRYIVVDMKRGKGRVRPLY